VSRRARSVGRRRARRRGKGPFLLLSLAVLVLDQWCKWLIEIHLPYHSVQSVIPGLLNLTHVRNTGVAFGLFAAAPGGRAGWPLSLLGLTALALVLLYFLHAHRRDRVLLSALAAIVGGALGNLIDRLANGGVTDFLDFHIGSAHWPSFNVADSAITVGIVLMAFDVVRSLGAAAPRSALPRSEEPAPR